MSLREPAASSAHRKPAPPTRGYSLRAGPRPWLASGLLIVALALLLGPVRAEPSVPSCSADSACLSLYERAKSASNAGDLDEALRLYKLAHEVRADPLLLFSIARILHKQGKTQAAVPYYTRFLATPTDDPVPRKKAEEYLAQIRGQSPPPPELSPNPSDTPAPLPASEARPVYKKWWFWLVIGGTAAAAATAVAVGVGVGNQGAGEPARAPFHIAF